MFLSFAYGLYAYLLRQNGGMGTFACFKLEIVCMKMLVIGSHRVLLGFEHSNC